jgi:hypothetical protein
MSLLVIGLIAMPAMAFAQTGNGAPNGPHYNLNIIGVENPKTAELTGSNRHTIFVGLGRNGQVTSRIYLTRGEFEVCDGNAFDAAFDCEGNQIQSQGAVFQLPCNTNLEDPDGAGPGELIPCDAGDNAAYEVYARALGQPGGSSTTTTCATDPDTQEVVCSSENMLLVRTKGRQRFENVTNELTSLVTDIDGDGDLDRVALFQGGLEDWFWQYDNRGLRLAQIRFYLLD